MATRRSRTGDRTPSDRRHVALTLPRDVKHRAAEAADTLAWSLGDWVLAAAAEHGPRLRAALGPMALRRRQGVEDAVYAALYVTAEEVAELDEQAVACGLNRSAFVTAVARLAVGDPLEDVTATLRPPGGRAGGRPGAPGRGEERTGPSPR